MPPPIQPGSLRHALLWPVNALAALLAGLAALAVLAMMLHVVADVAGKYFLRAPIPGTPEVVANYYMIAAVFLPLAWSEARGAPIVVDLLFLVSPRPLRRIMRINGAVLSILFYGYLARFSWEVAMRAWRIGETVDGIWRVVTWPAKFILPLGLGLACLLLLLRLLARDPALIEGDDAPAAIAPAGRER